VLVLAEASLPIRYTHGLMRVKGRRNAPRDLQTKPCERYGAKHTPMHFAPGSHHHLHDLG
jgi:hypothetical protein